MSDPPAPPMPPDPAGASGTAELPCPECGAPLAYRPGTDALVCAFCGSESRIEGAGDATGPWGERRQPDPEIRELAYGAAVAEALDAVEIEETPTLACAGCGAEVTLDPTTLADRCPFCATPLVRGEARTHRHPRPQGVLPFALDGRTARERMRRWLGSLWFAPSGLGRYARAGRPLDGVYLPHYTFDAAGEADYKGMRGDAYYVTRTRTVGGKRQVVRERRIAWRPAAGRVRRAFDDVLVLASGAIGGAETAADGKGWDLAALEPFRAEFMAGFRAEVPTLPLEDGYRRAEEAMRRMLVRDIRFDIGGDAQQVHSVDARYASVTFKHVLLPVWLASYRWRGRAYHVAVNGRTGEVSGERPYSIWKIAAAVAVAVIVAAAAGHLFAITR